MGRDDSAPTGTRLGALSVAGSVKAADEAETLSEAEAGGSLVGATCECSEVPAVVLATVPAVVLATVPPRFASASTVGSEGGGGGGTGDSELRTGRAKGKVTV